MKKTEKSPEFFMKKALQLASKAAFQKEVPVGALVIHENKVVGTGFNLREGKRRPTAHAEIIAIESAAKKLKNWRLENTTLYVTLEPCMMCWGAIVLSRIPKVVFGTKDPKAGVCGSMLSLHLEERFNHRPEVESGVMERECGEILSDFFLKLREKKTDIGHRT